ncbi:MAG: hypothetical protein J6Y16_10025, partial [Treponema sp.]|nr:hypothetical protein [Treponema sp.]
FTEMKSNPDGSPSTTLGKGFGLKCTVTNTLPAGNDISFKIQILKNGSDGYEKTATIQAGSNNQGVDWTQNPCTLKFPAYEEGVKKYLDLTAEIQNASNFIFQNLELGKTYSFGLKVTEFAYDWDSVSLNLSGIKIADAVDLPFDLSSVMDNFSIVGNELKKIEIKGFPFYLYARTPSATGSLSTLFNGIEMEGKLYISYQKDGEKYLDLMSENSSVKPTANKNISFKGDIPWPSDANSLITGNASDPNNVAYYLNKDEASIGADLKDIMKLMDASDIKLNYDIGLQNADSITVYQSMMPTSDSEAAINMSVDIATVLSFDFNLTAPVSVNIMEMTNEDYNTPDPETGKLSDLLNRSEISSQSEYEKYVDLINSVGLDYKLVNKLLPGLELSIDVDDRHVEEGYSNVHPTPLVLSEGRNKIEFTRDNIKSIMTNIFHPNVTINLGRPLAEGETDITGYISNKSELKVSRSAISDKDALSANVIVYVQMNGDEPIQVWGGQQ